MYANQHRSARFLGLRLVGKYSVEEVKTAMDFLSQKGMIDTILPPEKCTSKKRHPHREIGEGDADYDNLKIQSLIEKTANATNNF